VNVENTSHAIDPDAVLKAVHEVGLEMREVEKRANQEGNWNVFWKMGRITLGQPRLRTVSARDPFRSKQGKMAFRPAALVLFRMRASTEE
jgi:hypothetical protein